ncbi:hypothetical protein OIO90_002632 [Microbotryomycetes sp. JL221]|nr:hypothetical protein OIO90_002632 [Microbotryomycetes sp. JL221]
MTRDFDATVLVTYPLWPTTLVDDLKQRFKVVHFYPMASGTDYSGSQTRLEAPPEVLAETEILFTFHMPPELADISQAPRWDKNLNVGILGYGHIGREVARLATCFGARVSACTRLGRKTSLPCLYSGQGDPEGNLPEAWYQSSESASVGAFLKACDVVVNMLPSAPENVGFFGREQFRAMKDSSLFINVGRGDTVDQAALVEALEVGSRMTPDRGRTDAHGTAILRI